MTLAQKAEFYEDEIERYIKRTPFGYVAEVVLRKPNDKTSADRPDTDNDGLWTAMYGAGECFAYGATKDRKAKQRAKQAFEALRFLQKVTQECEHAPPKGYIARTVRSTELPDPNVGRLKDDRQEQKRDQLWKVYEPRWPRSADGKWFWKSDTSSDELDGHYFFYPLYFDLCADTDEERERVREVVRDVTDHLLSHDYSLIDHDGKPTRWGIYGPQFLNRDPRWWPDADQFDPERFFKGANKTNRPKYAYFPFGGGARFCLGTGLALLEGPLILATLAQKYRFRVADDLEIRPRAILTIMPEGGLPVTLERR